MAAALLSRKPVSREEGCYYRSSEHLPGFAGEGMSAAATAAAVVGPDEAMAHAATRGGVMVDVDSSAVSRSGSIRRAPQGFKPGGAVQTEVIRHDSHTGDDEEEEDDEDPLMVGYSAAARWRRINAGLDAVVPSIPLLSRRLARSQEELRREGAPALPPGQQTALPQLGQPSPADGDATEGGTSKGGAGSEGGTPVAQASSAAAGSAARASGQGEGASASDEASSGQSSGQSSGSGAGDIRSTDPSDSRR